MTPEEFRTNRQRTSNTKDVTFDDQLLNVALGLGEAGEFQNLVKKLIFHQHEPEQIVPKLIDEMGDLYYYLDWGCELLGITPGAVMNHNVEKLRARYPEGWDAERSRNRER